MRLDLKAFSLVWKANQTYVGYFKYKTIKQYMIKCLLKETMGVIRILIRVREEKAGIFQKETKEKDVGFAR